MPVTTHAHHPSYPTHHHLFLSLTSSTHPTTHNFCPHSHANKFPCAWPPSFPHILIPIIPTFNGWFHINFILSTQSHLHSSTIRESACESQNLAKSMDYRWLEKSRFKTTQHAQVFIVPFQPNSGKLRKGFDKCIAIESFACQIGIGHWVGLTWLIVQGSQLIWWWVIKWIITWTTWFWLYSYFGLHLFERCFTCSWCNVG